MKKIVLVLLFALLMVTPVFAKTEQVNIEGKKITLEVKEKDGRKLYPLRDLCTQLGMNIEVLEDDMIYIEQDGNGIICQPNVKIVRNATGPFITDVAPISINNTTYVPIRVISYMFGYDIDVSRGVTLTKKANFTPPQATKESCILMEDIVRADEVVFDLVQESYYVDVISYIYEYGGIDECDKYKQEINLAKKQAAKLGEKMNTQYGKDVYNASIELLNSFYAIFEDMEQIDLSGLNKSLQRCNNAQERYHKACDKLMDQLKKVAAKIK